MRKDLPSLNTTSGWLGAGTCFVSIRNTRGSVAKEYTRVFINDVGKNKIDIERSKRGTFHGTYGNPFVN